MVRISLPFAEKEEKGKLMFGHEVSTSVSRHTSQVSYTRHHRVLNEKKKSKFKFTRNHM